MVSEEAVSWYNALESQASIHGVPRVIHMHVDVIHLGNKAIILETE